MLGSVCANNKYKKNVYRYIRGMAESESESEKEREREGETANKGTREEKIK